MRRNVSGQTIGAQMVSATDGSNFTSTVTVKVTKDAGTQTAGGGSVVHEGDGYHSYAPTQSETDAAHVAFHFAGTGAISATVQVYPSSPQTGDAFAKATDVETDTQDIQNRLPAALVSGRIDASVGAIASNAITSASIAASALNGKGDWNIGKTGYSLSASGIQAIWDALTSALTTVGSIGRLLTDNVNATISSRLASASYTAPLDAAGTRSAIGLASANLDTQLDALPTANENADALLDRANAIETGWTLRGAIRVMASVLAGKVSGAGSGTETFRSITDGKDRVTSTVDIDGNRTAVTLDGS